jgi:recombination protein RecA
LALKLNVGTVLPPPSSQPAPPVVHKTITATTPVKSVKAPEKTAEQKKADKNKPAPATNLSAIVEAFRKTKPNVMVIANTIKPVARLATGVFEFDFHTGGGFPRGRYTIVFGPESSGKTNICYLAAAQAQRGPESCNKVVWVNVETTFDPLWAAQFGVDISKLLVINPGYGEEAVDAIDAVVRAVDVAAVFVDSIAALISSKEISQSAENYDVGTSALMIKRLVNKLMVAFGAQSRFNHYPAVVLINQTRYKIGVMFGNPETIPGGMAQKFLASLIIR